jgi:CHAT domain-containing protein
MAAKATLEDEMFDRLASLPDEGSRLRFLSSRGLIARSTVVQLDAAVRTLVRVDLKKAQDLAQAAVTVANQLGDYESRAYAVRATANSLGFLGQNKEASELHTQAIELFKQAKKPMEVGRTLSTSIQSLILLGEYERAHSAADEARKIFFEAGDTARLARLDINVANIFYRQDKFREALDCYRRAASQLLPNQDDEATIAAQHNIAVCLMMLNDYEGAEATYEELRQFCSNRDVPLAVAQTEYNIAYLHYLRGAYGRAIDTLRAAREVSQRAGDAYHSALCQLDLAEIYLELNLHGDASELAQDAFNQFEQLGMRYEGAKALCQSGICLSHQRQGSRAMEFFQRARAMFMEEGNQVWPSRIDFFQALTCLNEGRLGEARDYCLAALDGLRSSPLAGTAMLCRLLLARLSLKSGETKTARRECKAVLRELRGRRTENPFVAYQAHLVMGQIEDTCGNPEKARKEYRIAKELLEELRSEIHSEEGKISFLENRLEVYERLVDLCLLAGLPLEARREAWTCIEQAKSRGLLELITQRTHPVMSDNARHSELMLRLRKLREELNWYYHRIEAEELAQEPARKEYLADLRFRAEQCENQFLRLFRHLPSDEAEAAGMVAPKPVPLDTIREALGPDATLLEYFRVGDRIVAAIVTVSGLEIVSVTSAQRVTQMWRMLQFQLSKFHLGPDYIEEFQEQLLETTQHRLRELYMELLAPIRGKLKGRHLIIVPHEVLHYVPFHALFDGTRYLIDSFSVSYAPSASIYMQCRQKEPNDAGPALIFGVSDRQMPSIDEELKSIASILPDATLLVGDSRSEQILREQGPGSRLIHIAGHGVFRRDKPVLSGIRLGDSFLTLYDLYRLRLPVDQITLSGCSTGLSAVAAGDELIGLMRGLLSAGARTLLLTLWDVNDKTTADFMSAFYKRFLKYTDRAFALQEAMCELRDTYPHPHYWAPFVLVGNVFQDWRELPRQSASHPPTRKGSQARKRSGTIGSIMINHSTGKRTRIPSR